MAKGGGHRDRDGDGVRHRPRPSGARRPRCRRSRLGHAPRRCDRYVRAARRGPPVAHRRGPLMLVPQIDTSPNPVAAAAGTPEVSLQFGLEAQVQNALNLYLPMKNPTQMPALMAILQDAAPEVHVALSSLHYVHFARFL